MRGQEEGRGGLAENREHVTEKFHKLYYDVGDLHAGTWRDVHWFGVPIRKLPLDLWIFQEIIYESRPDLIIESGTFRGGSALYFASLLDILGNGTIVTIDIEACDERRAHPRIIYLTGSSLDPAVVDHVHHLASTADSTMVVLDSEHSADHVLVELDCYASLVSPGQYLVVEDTNVNGNPVAGDFGPGPREALEKWLPDHPEFAVDYSREKLLFTFNPGGWLRRVQ